MKLETSQKRHLYEESKWAVKEIDLMEDKRKLELRVGQSAIECTDNSLVGARSRHGADGSRWDVWKSPACTGCA
jgi:hypothetical protein